MRQNLQVGSQGLNKYRKQPLNVDSQQSTLSQPASSSSSESKILKGLQKYKSSSKSSSKSSQKQSSNPSSSSKQYKKYFMDLKNIFYQDRQSLKQLQKTKKKLKIYLPLWFFIALMYILISRLHKYEGICPQNATCKVFKRCNVGYELTEDGERCEVKKSIIQEIQNVCIQQVENLRYKFGNIDCVVQNIQQGKHNQNIGQDKIYVIEHNGNVDDNSVPIKHVTQLISTLTQKITDIKLQAAIQSKIYQFLLSLSNQKTYQFSFQTPLIIPRSKKHTFSCWFSIVSSTRQFYIFLFSLILLIILFIMVIKKIKQQTKAKQIYQYLLNKCLEQHKVNITLLQDQMKMMFGKIQQKIWVNVDKLRVKQAKISCYEEQFLYWVLR